MDRYDARGQAGDFARLLTSRGWEFTEQVLRGYRLPLDDDFRDPLDFGARLRSTVVLTEAHAHGIHVAEYIAESGTPLRPGTRDV